MAEVNATSTAMEAHKFSNYINEKHRMKLINTGTIDGYMTTYGTTIFKNIGIGNVIEAKFCVYADGYDAEYYLFIMPGTWIRLKMDELSRRMWCAIS